MDRIDLEKIKQVGLSACRKAGTVLLSYFGNVTAVEKKGAIDLVTEADRKSEQAVIETVGRAFPQHGILAEESGRYNEKSACQWIIDPLDGTTNFAHQLGLFSVSIAFAVDGDVVVGMVFNPIQNELFSAVKNQGAYLNQQPVRVSDTLNVIQSLLVTGFPYNHQDMFPSLMSRFSNCLTASQGVRRLGSAALDLCYVACGRFDGFWEENLKPWDTAAGMVIAKEAGARITDFSDQPYLIDKKEILATNGYIHDEMIGLLSLNEPTG